MKKWNGKERKLKKIKKTKNIILFFLFFIGLCSTTLLVVYIISLFFFVFGEGNYPGAIVFVPRWIFILSPFVFLEKNKEVRKMLDDLLDRLSS